MARQRTLHEDVAAVCRRDFRQAKTSELIRHAIDVLYSKGTIYGEELAHELTARVCLLEGEAETAIGENLPADRALLRRIGEVRS